MINIYMASSWKNAESIQGIARNLRNASYKVDDFTDESKGRFVFRYRDLGEVDQWNAKTFLDLEQARKAYAEDRKWIDWSDVVLLVLPAGKSAHLEAGYAVGRGKRLIIYHLDELPYGEFDVMYGFAELITDNYNEVHRHLQSIEGS